MTNILGIFAKYPQPGQVKTRLAAATSPEFAAQIAEAMLRDTLDRLAGIEAERWLVYAPVDAGAAMTEIARDRYRLTPQGDGDLGQRIDRFFRQRLRSGTERIVVIGSDSPTLPTASIALAFEQLESVDVVLGPATDGGYYLIGCARRVPPIFTDVGWGKSTVLFDTVARLDAACSLAVLPPWYDVDTIDDWHMLKGHVAALRRTGRDPGVPHVEKLIGVPIS